METPSTPDVARGRHLLIRDIAAEYPDVIAGLAALDPISTAAAYGGLLAVPKLQSCTLRLELLAHLSACYCSGTGAVSKEFLRSSVVRMGAGVCRVIEDPPESIFVSLVSTETGNYRLLEGILVGAGFHLQRILNIVEQMPPGGSYDYLRSSITCLLRLSDAALQKADVDESSLVEASAPASLSENSLSGAFGNPSCVQFSAAELERLGIQPSALQPFEYDLSNAVSMREDALFQTQIERRPIVIRDDTAYLLLPTAVATAIIRFVIEEICTSGQLVTLEGAIANEYRALFPETPFLELPPGPPLYFQQIDGGSITSVTSEIDAGRFLQIILYVEDLQGFAVSGLSEPRNDVGSLAPAVTRHIAAAYAEAVKRPGFTEGLTLLIGCGIGRPMLLLNDEEPPAGWALEMMSAYDFHTLCWVHDFNSISLFRLLSSVRALEREGVTLYNPNGLLNLVAWCRRLKGHLVPHSRIPDDFGAPGGDRLLAIDQTALRRLRHEVISNWQPRRALDNTSAWLPVVKLEPSYFAEDNAAPLFFSQRSLSAGRLRSVYLTKVRPYWFEVSALRQVPGRTLFGHWTMVNAWIRRAVPVIDQELHSLPVGPISVQVRFDELADALQESTSPPTEAAIRSSVRVTASGADATVRIEVGPGFEGGLQRPENLAERILVEGVIAGIASLSRTRIDESQMERLLQAICQDSDARYMHRFEARSYRDRIPRAPGKQAILIDDIDSAALNIGLGWRVRSRDAGPDIQGVEPCTAFLNALVASILDDICAELRRLNRRAFVDRLLSNHEITECDHDHWRRTAKANMSLHTDRQATLKVIMEHEAHLNAIGIASRVLLEAAVCECPSAGGRRPGKIEISRLMARVMLVFYWGGYSDAIYFGAAEPYLRVRPLGDVHFNQAFFETVYEPFGRLGNERQVRDAAETYSRHYEPAPEPPDIEEVLGPEFTSAWEREFGISIEALRRVLEAIEQECLPTKKMVITWPTKQVVDLIAEAAAMTANAASEVLNNFTLPRRSGWRSEAAGFTSRDWYPWRFRRRLSILRRPFLPVDDGENLELAFAPGLLRHAFALTIGTLHQGEIPVAQMNSRAMRSWLGSRNHKHRLAFNSEVAGRLRELGWEARYEMKVTGLLGFRLDRDYGDVDVVAWRPDSRRVLMIECKDVQYHKTVGEVAEQLYDFRGELDAKGRPDLLKKHLDRVAVLKEHRPAVAKTLRLQSPIEIEAHIVFKNPVPMRFVAERVEDKISLWTVDELSRI